MRKVVVFVEGQAEQIFVRELLLRYFDYNGAALGLRCFKLNAEILEGADYDFGDENALNFFQIINAGGDNKVLSAMIARSPKMFEVGFQIIIGLRDMYSKFYRELSPTTVSEECNTQIVAAADKTLRDKFKDLPVSIHYAIMEVEAWLLALLEKWCGDIKMEDIALYFRPGEDVEHVYHPADVIKSITSLMGNPYAKHAGQVNSLLSNIGWEDYQDLYTSGKCQSFNSFIDDLLDLKK